MTVEVKKTQISLKNGHMFAGVSIPLMAAGKAAVQLTFGLPYRADSPVLFSVSEPYTCAGRTKCCCAAPNTLRD